MRSVHNDSGDIMKSFMIRSFRHLGPGLLVLLLAGAIAAPAARALPFSANHLLVTTETGVLEFDPALGQIVDQLELAGAQNPCFLPNGNLLLLQGEGVLEIAPSGEVVREIELGVTAAGVALGPDGLIYVNTLAGLLRVDLETGAFETVTELAGILDPRFLPNGHLLLAPVENPDLLLEVDPGAGAIVREIAAVGGVTGLAPGPGGLLVVTTAQAGILLLDVVTGEVVDAIELAGAQNPCFLPNGNLLVIDLNGALLEVDLATGRVVDQLPVPEAAIGVTGVPFRFAATMRGVLGRADGGIERLAEAAVLSLASESRTLVLRLDDAGELRATFETVALVLNGFELAGERFGRRRLIHGAQVPPAGSEAPVASLALSVRGRVDARDLFVPARASGTLHAVGAPGIFTGTIHANELLNP